MSKDTIIPVKHGTKALNTEAYVNLDTGDCEEGSWDKGPSNGFYKMGKKISTMQQDVNRERYNENYDKIFRKDVKKEEDDGKETDKSD